MKERKVTIQFDARGSKYWIITTNKCTLRPDQTLKELCVEHARAYVRDHANVSSAESGQTLPQLIRSLRMEARLTIEQVADKLKISVRSAYRHESGQTRIRAQNLKGYEDSFSKELNRKIELPNIPPPLTMMRDKTVGGNIRTRGGRRLADFLLNKATGYLYFIGPDGSEDLSSKDLAMG